MDALSKLRKILFSATGWPAWAITTVVLVAIDYLDSPGNPLTTPSNALPLNPWPLLVTVPWGMALIGRELRRQGRVA
jgi:hypothetical protein